MKRFYVLFLIALSAACSSGGDAVTMSSFYEIPIGATQEEVVSTMGKPAQIHRKHDGIEEYEYIERLKIGSRNVNERHYYVVIKGGKVVGKRIQQSSPPPYGFDSYEMQTTQNQDGN